MRPIRVFALLALTVIPSGAATVTFSYGYEFPHGGPSSKSWTLPVFDTSLGELTSVDYYASGRLWADYAFVSRGSGGLFTVAVDGFFNVAGVGPNIFIDIPGTKTPSIWVGPKGTVAGSIESTANKSGSFIGTDAFLPGQKPKLTASMYFPQNYGYWTTLDPDVCWHGRIDFTLIYNFTSTAVTSTPEPATSALMLSAAPLALLAWRRQQRMR